MQDRNSPEVGLTRETALRLLDALKWVDAQRATTPGGRSDIRNRTSNYVALVTSEIGAGNLSATPKTLGKGQGTLYYIDDTGGTTANLVEIPGQTNITIYNGGSSIASGRVIQVKFVPGGLIADVDYC